MHFRALIGDLDEGTWIENISESRIFTIFGDFREILGIIWEEGGTCLNIRETPESFGRVGNTAPLYD